LALEIKQFGLTIVSFLIRKWPHEVVSALKSCSKMTSQAVIVNFPSFFSMFELRKNGTYFFSFS